MLQDVNDELADMLEQADEVQEALGRQYGMPEIDDDELAAELDALGNDLFLFFIWLIQGIKVRLSLYTVKGLHYRIQVSATIMD